MAKKVTITFDTTVLTKPEDKKFTICPVYLPEKDNTIAADTSIMSFIKASVAHPGLVAMLKQAMIAESSKFETITEDEDFILYLAEVAPAVADQGFTIVVADVQ